MVTFFTAVALNFGGDNFVVGCQMKMHKPKFFQVLMHVLVSKRENHVCVGKLREDTSLHLTAENTPSLFQWDFHLLFLLKCVNNYHQHHPRLHIPSHVS